MAARRAGLRLANALRGSASSAVTMPRLQPTAPALVEVPAVSARKMAPSGSRMGSTQAVRIRMKSVKSIQKITKAMKMVAASKMRGAQVRAEKSRGVWQPFVALLGDNPGVETKKNVILTVSADRGLCGGINTTSVKFSRALFDLCKSFGEDTEATYVVIGEKGKVQLQRYTKKEIAMAITEVRKMPTNFTQVSMMVDEIVKNVEYDSIRLIFNKFHSAVSFLPTVATLLSPATMAAELEAGKLGDLNSYEVEGADSTEEVLQNLGEFQFASVLYNALLENACSEEGARMSAMDSSTRNASEMLAKLTLSYNRTRQANITTELTEIISGAAALETAE